ncbi:MAG: hypothetical protein KKD46_03355 [Euryarchaeota archaeon]|nr:hypothetical protein [Euryarchaeota archaeon]MBU4339937.1 hypothetical protein [Euryarchaeota archaeon]MBU4453679.1 hypothetical protein [Euryarchaeota archaeon]MCG2737737.1 hypothetical protein [Candidatus Methanoperedenaceae archaeon]
MKTYKSEVEGLLMYSPAVFLHKGQKLKAAQDTIEILQALTAGKLVLVEEGNAPAVEVETPKPEPKMKEKQEQENITQRQTKPEKTARPKSEKPAKDAPPAFL